MNLRPLGNRILVEPVPVVSTGKIVLPQNVKPEYGPVLSRVLKIGPKVKTVKVGDRVLSHAFDRGAVPIDDSPCRLIDENQVLLIFADRDIV